MIGKATLDPGETADVGTRRPAAAPDPVPTLEERINDAVRLSDGTMPIAVVVEDDEMAAGMAHLARSGRRGRPVEILAKSAHLELLTRPAGRGDA